MAAILQVGATEKPPLRIQLGSDAFGLVTGNLEFVAAEQNAWRELSVSTDVDDA